jgi:hypothetical protein
LLILAHVSAGTVFIRRRAVTCFAFFRARSRVFFAALLGTVCLVSAADYSVRAPVRRTFEFYESETGAPLVEERFLAREKSREKAVGRYLAEYLLGAGTMRAAPLFHNEAVVESLIIRDRTAYIDISAAALIPQAGSGIPGVLRSFQTLEQGLLRNFPALRTVKFFTDGVEIRAAALPE